MKARHYTFFAGVLFFIFAIISAIWSWGLVILFIIFGLGLVSSALLMMPEDDDWRKPIE